MQDEKKLVHDFYSSWAHSVSLYEKWAACYGISYPDLMTLYALYVQGDITQKTISACLGLPKQTIHSSVRSLAQKDYVQLSPGEKDRREKKVSLTKKGTSYAETILSPLFEAEETVCKNIGYARFYEMIETNNLFNLLFEKEIERTQNHHVKL